MPGKHDPAKKFISFSIYRDLWYRLTQEAQSRGIDRSSFVVGILESEMKIHGVKLTKENQALVDAEISAERKRRAENWSGYEACRAKLDARQKEKENKTKKGTEKK